MTTVFAFSSRNICEYIRILCVERNNPVNSLQGAADYSEKLEEIKNIEASKATIFLVRILSYFHLIFLRIRLFVYTLGETFCLHSRPPRGTKSSGRAGGKSICAGILKGPSSKKVGLRFLLIFASEHTSNQALRQAPTPRKPLFNTMKSPVLSFSRMSQETKTT